MKTIFTWACFAVLASAPLRAQHDAPSLPMPGVNLQKPKPIRESVAGYLIQVQEDTDAGELERALEDANSGLALAQRSVPPDADQTAFMQANVVRLLVITNRELDARKVVERQLRLDATKVSAHDVEVAIARAATDAGGALQFSDNPKNVERAPALFQKALDINKKEFGPNSEYVATSTYHLAGALVLNKRLKQAEAQYWQAIDLFANPPVSDITSALLVYHELASLFVQEHRYTEAEKMVREAMTLEKTQTLPNPSVDKQLHDLLAEIVKDAKAAAPK